MWRSASTRVFLVLAGAAVAVALSAAAIAAPGATRVIKVTATQISGTRQQRPPAGFAGDVVVASDRLRNAVAQFGKPKGAVVGRDRYRLVFATAYTGTASVTATLPDGTIRCRGPYDLRRPSVTLRAVGGTKAYAGATGTCEARSSGRTTLNVYRLRVPG
jgi:hypothetical protein